MRSEPSPSPCHSHHPQGLAPRHPLPSHHRSPWEAHLPAPPAIFREPTSGCSLPHTGAWGDLEPLQVSLWSLSSGSDSTLIELLQIIRGRRVRDTGSLWGSFSLDPNWETSKIQHLNFRELRFLETSSVSPQNLDYTVTMLKRWADQWSMIFSFWICPLFPKVRCLGLAKKMNTVLVGTEKHEFLIFKILSPYTYQCQSVKWGDWDKAPVGRQFLFSTNYVKCFLPRCTYCW